MKTQPSNKPSRSGSDRYHRLGGTGEGGMSMSCFDLITVMEDAHPANTEAVPWRYDRQNPEMAALMVSISIESQNGKTGQIGSIAVAALAGVEGAFVESGNRQVWARRYLVNEKAVGADGKPIVADMSCDVSFGMSRGRFLARYRRANKHADDDPVTIARQMRAALDGDDNQGVKPSTVEQVATDFGCDVRYVEQVTHPETGLVALSSHVAQMVAQGDITEAQALELAPAKHDLQTALAGEIIECQGKVKPSVIREWVKAGEVVEVARIAKPTAPSLVKLRRLADEFKGNRDLDDMSARALLSLLLDEPDYQGQKSHMEAVRSILSESSKPGPKPKPASNFTPEENAATQAMLDQAAIEREEAENKKGKTK